MRVPELGPGSGLFTAEAARQVGSHGQLLSVDLQIEMLRPLYQHIQEAAPRNVFLTAATAEHLPFPDNSVDLVFAIAVLPMIRSKPQALRELRRVFRPHGILAVSEKVIEPEYVPAFVTQRWRQRAGFRLTKRIHKRLWYMLLFRPACKSHNHEDTKFESMLLKRFVPLCLRGKQFHPTALTDEPCAAMICPISFCMWSEDYSSWTT